MLTSLPLSGCEERLCHFSVPHHTFLMSVSPFSWLALRKKLKHFRTHPWLIFDTEKVDNFPNLSLHEVCVCMHGKYNVHLPFYTTRRWISVWTIVCAIFGTEKVADNLPGVFISGWTSLPCFLRRILREKQVEAYGRFANLMNWTH
jgi:hypothetical protein